MRCTGSQHIRVAVTSIVMMMGDRVIEGRVFEGGDECGGSGAIG